MKPKYFHTCLLFGLIWLLLSLKGLTLPADASTQLIKIESRQGTTQEFILIKPENPVASVILLPGNNGCLKLSSLFGSINIGSLKGEFLVQNRDRIAQNNFIVAVMDAPSDNQARGNSILGCLNSLTNDKELVRMSKDHAQDISSVVSYLKKASNTPVWLVGNSMGTISAANAAIRCGTQIDGLVLIASKTRSNKDWGAVYESHPNVIIDMDLGKITVPTLIIHHAKDKCDSSVPDQVPRIKDGLINASKADILYLLGGEDLGGSDGCSPRGFHQFNGIDNDVIEAISKFILSSSR